MRNLLLFLKNEIVLTAATVLAILSAFLIPPGREYLDYIDFRTLALLFCLMAVMAGFQRLGLFKRIAKGLLKSVGTGSIRVILVLVFLCFFFGMLITNDVALITFVPFTFTVLELLGEEKRNRMIVPVVVLETLGANLGSMMTPIGNPQNLYLYGKAGISVGEFILIMLPYSCMAGVLLVIWSIIIGKRSGGPDKRENAADNERMSDAMQSDREDAHPGMVRKQRFLLLIYAALFLLSLLTVARILPCAVTFLVTLSVVAVLDRKTLFSVDYCLLLTFIAFFVFIGNMGRIPAFADFLANIITGHEVPVAVLASQAISNVPAALLLSGFTDRYGALVIGVNLGGMGTLIASMASLISYKYVAKLMPEKKGKYFLCFTYMNLIFLAVLMTGYFVIQTVFAS